MNENEIETNLDIIIRSVVDEDSAKKAPKEISKIVLGALKDGYIKIPAAISDEFDTSKASAKLIKAQKDFVTQWEKMSKEGFSSSEEDLKSFIDKFSEFKRLMGKEGKAGSKQNRAIRNLGLNEVVQSYKKATTKLNTELKKITEQQISDIKSIKSKPKKARNLGKHSDEEIQDAIDKHDREVQNKQLKGNVNRLGSTAPREKTRSWVNAGNTSTRDLHLSEVSPYGSIGAYIQAKHMQEEAERTKASLKTWTDKDYEVKSKGRGSRTTTEKEYKSDVATKALSELKETLVDIEKGKVDITKEMIVDQLGLVKDKFAEIGKDLEETSIAIKNALEKPYSDSSKKRLGGATGKEKGVGPGHELAKSTQKFIYDLWGNLIESTDPARVFAKRFARDMMEASNTISKTTKKLKSESKKINSQYEQSKASSRESGEYEELQDLADSMKTGSTAIKDSVDKQKATTEKQITNDRIENSAERVADREAGKKSQELVKTSKEDLTSGFNTDSKADEAISVMKQLGEYLSPIAKTLESIANAIINPPEKKEGPTDKTELQPKQKRKIKQPSVKKENQNGENLPVPFVKDKWFYPNQFGKDIYGRKVVHGGQERKTTAQDRTAAIEDFRPTTKLGIKSDFQEQMRYRGANLRAITNQVNKDVEDAIKQHIEYLQNPPKLPRSEISTSLKDPSKLFTRLKDSIADLLGVTAKYKKVMSATSEEQDALAAKTVKTYGIRRGGNITGDKIAFARNKSLWKDVDKFKEVFGDLKISEGAKVDTTEVTDKLGKILSGKAMRNAQMGGSPLRNAFGYASAFIGMPSIEKSRAAAEALNQINANIREAMNSTLADIKEQESTLAGMLESGDLKLDDKGNVLEGSTIEAKTLVVQLENTKLILDSILADVKTVDKTIDKSPNNIRKVMKQLNFTSPVLLENNAIVNNINAGYDKGGKALKFQSRLAEILNYSFQLMSRHVGQIFKSFMLSINPINKIKQAFTSFASYNTKWQRTMNVIKYNMRTIVRPFMDWLAQKLVNIIGFFDIISMKIQEAFGRIPISVFDQAAAQSEKIHEELEAGANVTAGFDELHDIGSDNTGANDLLGDIYTPQLSEKWKELATKIGNLFKGLIQGDLGFGEVAKEILKILGQLLANIASDIWEWFKKTAIGKYITEHWKGILASVLGAFLAWKLLKIAGTTLFNALFGKLTGSAIGSVFSKISGWITKALGATAFGKGIIEGVTSLFTSGGGLLSTLKSVFVGHEAITAFGAWGETLGAIFAQSLLAVAGVALAGFSLAKGADAMQKNTSYNVALKQYGGKDEDKKSNVGAGVLSTLGSTAGGALAGTAIAPGIGTAIGAAVGLVAGLINTALAPALEKAAIKARDMNNEMQKIEYYEGAVKGAQTQVNIFDEQLRLLKEALDLDTESVYKQGEQLGISKARMEELVTATQNGTFTTEMLTGKEVELSGSLTNLAEKQQHVTEVSGKLENAQKKLLKAQTELSIAQDVEAGNFEIAAARIEVAEEQGVYSTEQATAKRIQLYKMASKEERDNLLQDLTKDQRARMGEYMATTKEGLGKLAEAWEDSSEKTKKAILDSVGEDTQRQLEQNLNSMDAAIQRHSSVWQKIGDTLTEVFSFFSGIKIDTWTYNKEDKYYKEAAKQIKKDPERANLYDDATLEELKRRGLIPKYALGTNYVPNDGLAYLHQGEAVIPKKYNQPFTMDNSNLEDAVYSLARQVEQIGSKVDQGINIKGQFVQRGSDLVATVQKANNKLSNNILNNKVYAR